MYSRKTELRHLSSKDVYKLAQVLDPNGSWKKLMQIIPKSNDANHTIEYKYNNDHIQLIENESIRRLRLATEILFDEWGTSGKKRPTVGQLLELLVKAELFRAADMVALNFLNEPPPERPSTGPAAKINLYMPFNSEMFGDVEEMLKNVSEPSTETLLENVNSSFDANKDFFTKYDREEKDINSLIRTPPPEVKTELQDQQNVAHSQETITKLSHICEFLNQKNSSYTSETTEPKTELTDLCQDSAINRIPISSEGENCMLPMISALNITNKENDVEAHASNNLEPLVSLSRTSCHTSESSNIDEDDDDDIGLPEGLADFDDEDVSAPNRSLIEQRSSNNDSSLTNVTGTSGDNSFELSMHDGSLDASNDNIPHLTVLL